MEVETLARASVTSYHRRETRFQNRRAFVSTTGQSSGQGSPLRVLILLSRGFLGGKRRRRRRRRTGRTVSSAAISYPGPGELLGRSPLTVFARVCLHVLFYPHLRVVRAHTHTPLAHVPLYARRAINVRAYGARVAACRECSLYCRYVAVLPSTYYQPRRSNVIRSSCQIHATTENFFGIGRQTTESPGLGPSDYSDTSRRFLLLLLLPRSTFL